MAKYARYGARGGSHSHDHGKKRYGRNSGFTSIDELEMIERGIGGESTRGVKRERGLEK